MSGTASGTVNWTIAGLPVVRFDTATHRFVAVPIDLGPEGDQVFLVA